MTDHFPHPSAPASSTPDRRLIAVGTITPTGGGTAQIRHALTALSRTAAGRRRLIAACAEEYLSQIDRRVLPVGWNQPITDDHYNRVDAYRMRHGDQFASMLGIACQASDRHLPDTARAVLAEINAPVDRLVAWATDTGQPAAVALLHLTGGAR